MVNLTPMPLIGGTADGEILKVDRKEFAFRVPLPEDQQDSVPLKADLYNVIPAVVFGRVVFVAKTGGGAPVNEELARAMLKPGIFEAWQAGRSYP